MPHILHILNVLRCCVYYQDSRLSVFYLWWVLHPLIEMVKNVLEFLGFNLHNFFTQKLKYFARQDNLHDSTPANRTT